MKTFECSRIQSSKIITKMPKSIKVARVDVGSMDNEAVEPKNFTGIEKTLKILKFVCIGIAISAVAGTATFAGIIYNQVRCRLSARIETDS